MSKVKLISVVGYTSFGIVLLLLFGTCHDGDFASVGKAKQRRERPLVDSTQHYEIGTTLHFGANGHSELFRVAGWSSTEESHTWTEGTSAVLALPGLPPHKPLRFSAVLAGLTNGNILEFQPVDVYANDRKVASWKVGSGRETFSALIPPTPEQSAGILKLEFRIPKAFVPKDAGISLEARQLGLCFFGIEITEA